jgi:hypothetical protein
MAVEVGKLVVELEARVARLESGLRRGNRAITNFQSRSTRAFSRVGRSLGRLIRRFSGIGVAIGAAAATFGFAQFIRGSIGAASAVAEFEIRLRSLIGSQEEAAATLGRLEEVAQTVAPSLRDIIEAAATLGTVALGSSTKIEQLTKTSLNIAAITGLTLTQSAQNLQRALASGIGAADLFRERGVRAVLEALTGIPNLVEQPISVVAKAFEEVFGPGGRFGTAAEQFAKTLPGAISVTGDALFKLQSAFGDAISPVVIAFLKGTVIPALNAITDSVKSGETNLTDFARKGLKFAVDGLILFAKIGTVGFATFLDVLRLLRLQLTVIATTTRTLVLPLVLVGEAVGVFNEGTGKALANGIVETVQNTIKADKEMRELKKSLIDFSANVIPEFERRVKKGFDPANIEKFRKESKEAQDDLNKLQEAFAEQQLPIDVRQLREQEAAQARLLNLIEKRAIATAKGREPIEAEIRVLQNEATQINQLVQDSGVLFRNLQDAIKAIGVDLARSDLTDVQRNERLRRRLALQKQLAREEARRGAEVLGPAAQRQAEIEGEIVRLQRRQVFFGERREGQIAAVAPLLARLRDLDAERADLLQRALFARLGETAGIEEQTEVLEEYLDKLNAGIKTAEDRAKKELGPTIGKVLGETIADSLVQGALDGSIDFAKILADTSAQFLRASLTEALKGFGKSLDKIIEDNVGEGASKLTSAFSGALGLIGLVASKVFQGTEVSTTAGRVQSAVTSTQRVRGVVALELRRQTGMLDAIRRNTGGAAVAQEPVGPTADELLIASRSTNLT